VEASLLTDSPVSLLNGPDELRGVERVTGRVFSGGTATHLVIYSGNAIARFRCSMEKFALSFLKTADPIG